MPVEQTNIAATLPETANVHGLSHTYAHRSNEVETSYATCRPLIADTSKTGFRWHNLHRICVNPGIYGSRTAYFEHEMEASLDASRSNLLMEQQRLRRRMEFFVGFSGERLRPQT